jgi:16S rRNA (guanine527-N7)-methyltransferase
MGEADDNAIRAPEASPAANPASLTSLAHAAGLEIAPAQAAQFDAYRSLLLEWNARTNLTAITDPAEVDRRLFLDSMLLLPALDAALGLMPASPHRMIDVGSGAGFPGLPIKIMRPDLDITLIEATGKKVAFLDACIAALGLEGITTIHGRAEELARDPAYRERFDLVTARAVASLPALLELGMPFLHLGGRGLFPKGLDIATELSAADAAAPLVGGKIVASRVLPSSQTTLVAVAKVGATPKKYPRRAGIPAREPLGHLDRSMFDHDSRRNRRNRRHAPESVRPDLPRAGRPAAARGSS